MTFPVEMNVFGRTVPMHAAMEMLAYAAGVQTYALIRRRGSERELEQRHDAQADSLAPLWILVFCIFGALIGCKVLAVLESPMEYWAARHDPRVWLGGKTIVGGLIGGWIGVEIGKRWFGIRTRTGDAYVLPLVIGIAIGRVGCFLTGLPDHTYGVATSLPWGVDFGDGVSRHPTQIYEIVVVLLLGGLIWLRSRRPYLPGELFRLFMLGYFTFRFFVEFIKPRYTGYARLSMIQWASAAGAIAAVVGLWRVCARQPAAVAPAA